MDNKRSWSEFKTWHKWGIVVAGMLQIGLFAAAWADLSRRSEEKLNGRINAWRAALFLSGIGPIAYFAKGRKQSGWSEANIPDMSGKVVVVTGANSGIGYETARALAQHGATVVMACRNLEKANRAAAKIGELSLTGELAVMHLDLADLDSVRRFAASLKSQYMRLDLLINNAGVMVPPTLARTTQGFEAQFGVNHLGHFSLTMQLLELLNSTPDARVVTVSSLAHRFGAIDFDDLNWQTRPYHSFRAYGQSKLANLLFTYELQRRLAASGHATIAVAAHPGYTATGVQSESGEIGLMDRLLKQNQAIGALPTLYAATAAAVTGGEYIGPSGYGEFWGNPECVESSERSHNRTAAEELWLSSEILTRTTLPARQRPFN